MWWIFGAVIVAIFIITAIELGSDNILLWLAQKNVSRDLVLAKNNIPDDKWWSPVRFKPTEGKILYIMKGNPKGPLHQVFHSVTGWTLDDATGDMTENPPAPPIIPPNKKVETTLDRLGLVWVGFFKGTYSREVKYTSYETVGTEQKLVPKTRPGSEFLFQTNLAVEIKGAEDNGNFPLNGKAIATMRIINPRKAEFMAGKPEVQAMAAMESAARIFIGTKSFSELRGEVHVTTPPDLITQFGIEMLSFRVEQLDPADPKSDYATVTRLKEVEKLKADAATETARGIEVLATAEAKRVSTVYAAKKGNEALAIAEAIEKFTGDTLVLGNVPGTSVPVAPTKVKGFTPP
jgi:hypothetical protein